MDRLAAIRTMIMTGVPSATIADVDPRTVAQAPAAPGEIAQLRMALAAERRARIAAETRLRSVLAEIAKRLEQVGGSGPAPTAPPMPQPSTARPFQASAPRPVPSAPLQTSSIAAPEAWVSLWPSFLERLGQQKMSLAAYLAESRPIRAEGTSLLVGLPGFALHQEVINHDDNRRLIERLLAELSGQAVTVRYETLTESMEPLAAAPASETVGPPMIQDIVKLFNATVVDQPPRPA